MAGGLMQLVSESYSFSVMNNTTDDIIELLEFEQFLNKKVSFSLPRNGDTCKSAFLYFQMPDLPAGYGYKNGYWRQLIQQCSIRGGKYVLWTLDPIKTKLLNMCSIAYNMVNGNIVIPDLLYEYPDDVFNKMKLAGQTSSSHEMIYEIPMDFEINLTDETDSSKYVITGEVSLLNFVYTDLIVEIEFNDLNDCIEILDEHMTNITLNLEDVSKQCKCTANNIVKYMNTMQRKALANTDHSVYTYDYVCLDLESNSSIKEYEIDYKLYINTIEAIFVICDITEQNDIKFPVISIAIDNKQKARIINPKKFCPRIITKNRNFVLRHFLPRRNSLLHSRNPIFYPYGKDNGTPIRNNKVSKQSGHNDRRH